MGLLRNLNGLFNFIHFCKNKRILQVSFRVDIGNNIVSLFPTSLGGKPTWRFGKEEKEDEKNDSRDHLESPCGSEGTRTSNETASI